MRCPVQVRSDIDGRIAELKGKMQRLHGMTGPEVNRIRDDFWQEVSQLISEKRHQDTLRHQQEQLQISRQNLGVSQANLNLRQRESILSPEGFEKKRSLAEVLSGARAAERPLPAGQAEEIGDLNALVGVYDKIETQYKPGYVGPVAGRAARIKEVTGQIGAQEVEFRANLANVRNVILKARSGGAVTEGEAARLLQELPEATDSPPVFEG